MEVRFTCIVVSPVQLYLASGVIYLHGLECCHLRTLHCNPHTGRGHLLIIRVQCTI